MKRTVPPTAFNGADWTEQEMTFPAYLSSHRSAALTSADVLFYSEMIHRMW